MLSLATAASSGFCLRRHCRNRLPSLLPSPLPSPLPLPLLRFLHLLHFLHCQTLYPFHPRLVVKACSCDHHCPFYVDRPYWTSFLHPSTIAIAKTQAERIWNHCCHPP